MRVGSHLGRYGIWAVAALLLLLPAATSTADDATISTLGAGTAWATPVYAQGGVEPGPTVMVLGGVHGDEPAGALAADQIRHWPVTRGQLVVVPRANVSALKKGTRRTPGVEKSLGDLNRNFPRAGKTEAPRGPRAEALWNLITQVKPDWVLDLHEGYHFHQQNPKSVGSTVIHSGSPEARRAARLMVRAVNGTIASTAKWYVPIGPPVNGSLARAAAVHAGAHAMILETTTRKQARSRRVRQHRTMVHRLLTHLEMLPRGLSPDVVRPGAEGDEVWVALYDSLGTSGRGVPLLSKQLAAAEGIRVMRIGPEEIRSGALFGYDAVIFSGGLGSVQARTLDAGGREAVRAFIEGGGGYVGICAGAYLCLEGYSWGLKVVNAKTISPKWARGGATLPVELTDEGKAIFGEHDGPLPILYHNGPVVTDAGASGLGKMIPLGYFREEVAKNGTPKGVMKDSPAIFASQFGAGRVIAFSPHPEQTKGREGLILSAVRWVVKKEKAAKPADTEAMKELGADAALFRKRGRLGAKRETLARLFRADTREAWSTIRDAIGGMADQCADRHAERVKRWADIMALLATPLPHTEVEKPLLRLMDKLAGDVLAAEELLLHDTAWRLTQRPAEAWRPLMSRASAPGRNPWMRMTAARMAGWRLGHTKQTSARVAVTNALRRAIQTRREKDPRMAIAALEALAEQPEPPTEAMVLLLDHPAWTVRVRTAQLLQELRDEQSVPHLVDALVRAGGRERSTLGAALRSLTGQNFDADPAVWKRWIQDGSKQAEGEAERPSGAHLYGLPIESERVLFLIDVSGSMTETFRAATEDAPAVSRLESAKQELQRLIGGLSPATHFNVIAFSTAVIPWKDGLRPADDDAKASVREWIDGWSAAGNTCMWGALREAFRQADHAPRGGNVPALDTIVLLSDGEPTYYGITKPGFQPATELLRWVGRWNPTKAIRIHTVSLADGKGRGLLKDLARRHGGRFETP